MSDEPGTGRRLGVAARLFVGLQYFLPQIGLTRLINWLAQREARWLKDAMIRLFARAYSVDVREAAADVPDGYRNFNAFFTRTLRDGAREIDETRDAIVAPCDGVISETGPIEAGRLLQAKGFLYSAAELLDDTALAARFDGGRFMTIYLAPYDYHRVHMPLAGRIVAHRHVPGRLFSVNGATAAAVPRLFARNERRVFGIDGDIPAAMIMVGALNVGSISTTWSGTELAGAHERTTTLALPDAPLARGETVGWFNMGSTVILLVPPGASFDPAHVAGDVLRMGERIGATRQ